MSKRKIIALVSVLVVLIVVGAALFVMFQKPMKPIFSSGNPQGLVAGDLENEFFDLSVSERIGKLRDYSLEDQYKLFIFFQQVVHPPNLSLAEEFAKNGESAIPVLKKELIETEYDMTIRDIAWTLYWMNRLGTYDVKRDKELMTLLKERRKSMKGFGRFVQDNIDEINEMPFGKNAP